MQATHRDVAVFEVGSSLSESVTGQHTTSDASLAQQYSREPVVAMTSNYPNLERRGYDLYQLQLQCNATFPGDSDIDGDGVSY